MIHEINLTAIQAGIGEVLGKGLLCRVHIQSHDLPDLDDAGINEFEHIRESLRDLIKYIPVELPRGLAPSSAS